MIVFGNKIVREDVWFCKGRLILLKNGVLSICTILEAEYISGLICIKHLKKCEICLDLDRSNFNSLYVKRTKTLTI
jgi:hypothetical protein